MPSNNKPGFQNGGKRSDFPLVQCNQPQPLVGGGQVNHCSLLPVAIGQMVTAHLSSEKHLFV